PLERMRGRPARGPAGLSALSLILGLAGLAGQGGMGPEASAHEVRLFASSYRTAAGQEIQIAAATGEGFGGQPAAFARERTVSFELLAARRLDLTVVAAEGDSVFARFIAPD